jgi:hypothetical protein
MPDLGNQEGSMTVDQAATAWESMLCDANVTGPPPRRSGPLRGHAVVAMRTTVFVILAALAILVLLPAALTAQASLAG